MNFKQFIKNVKRTEVHDVEAIKRRLASGQLHRLLHASVGLASEAGELLDAVKAHIFYGKKLDLVNLAEEAGDALWFLAVLLDYLDLDLETIMEQNISKLRKRFPNKFDEAHALKRDLGTERKDLENSVQGLLEEGEVAESPLTFPALIKELDPLVDPCIQMVEYNLAQLAGKLYVALDEKEINVNTACENTQQLLTEVENGKVAETCVGAFVTLSRQLGYGVELVPVKEASSEEKVDLEGKRVGASEKCAGPVVKFGGKQLGVIHAIKATNPSELFFSHEYDQNPEKAKNDLTEEKQETSSKGYLKTGEEIMVCCTVVDAPQRNCCVKVKLPGGDVKSFHLNSFLPPGLKPYRGWEIENKGEN